MDSYLILALLGLGIGSLLLLLKLNSRVSFSEEQLSKIFGVISTLANVQEKDSQLFREEISRNREEVSLYLSRFLGSNEQKLENMRQTLETKLRLLTDGTREELQCNAAAMMDRLTEMVQLSQNQLNLFSGELRTLSQINEQKLEQMRATLEQKVKDLQEDNAKKLDQMREVVDEKLHTTLEKRLSESFRLVSERLELVHEGLGEMQRLAAGVGDLKKVLTNVKTRGTWGEVQLGNILEDILTPDQYAVNVSVKKNAERVDFAIKLPGQGGERQPVWLPIDAKFPMEDYYRLLEAYENADPAEIEQARKQLENCIKNQAKLIQTKYITPPETVNFAIMFLPTEGLYAEVLRRPGLFETIERTYSVTIAGPTTLVAILNSLSLGFRTLAIQKRSSEVWALLGTVKTQFKSFGESLERTKKKLQEASQTLEETTKHSQTLVKKLKEVEALPEPEMQILLEPDCDGAISLDSKND